MNWLIVWLTTFLAAAALTGVLRRYALSRNLLDVPNARSSHCAPIPRGGGLAIVVVFLAALVWLAYSGEMTAANAAALSGAGGLVALIGFLDDHGHIPAGWRLLSHFLAVAWAFLFLGSMPPVSVLSWTLEQGVLSMVLVAFYLVWLLNLYNFMDGIDGIAGIETVSVGLCAAALAFFSHLSPTSYLLPAMLAAGAGGFLLWNFPSAKIFMGDVGSGFLGLTLGLMSLLAAREQPQLLWSWLILLGVFIVDATVTLARRLLRGEKVYVAHRSHAYQFAARRCGSHWPVTIAVLLINLGWLFPLAFAVSIRWLDGFVGLLIAYSPLVGIALYFRAGKTEN